MLEVDRIFVTRSSLPPFEEYIEEIKEIWDSHWLTNMGEKHQELEAKLREYLQVPYLSLFVNGHMALELALQAFNLQGEVITTPFTFVSTTHAIVRNGLRPVFCDIRAEDFTLDADQIESLITEKTSAIVPVHVYGNVCQVEKIQEIADRHHLKVLYDAAHAFAVTYLGHGVGSYGDASMFSFHATKVFNSIEGGAVCFAEAEYSEKLYHLKNFGIRDEITVESIGANAKMNEFQAAMGLCNLRHVEEEIEKRKRVYERYQERLEGIEGLRLPRYQEGVKKNYAYYPVIFEEKKLGISRDDIYRALMDEGIHARKYFYPPTNEITCIRDQFGVQKTPIAERIARQVLTLPLYADLEMKEVDKICAIIIRSVKKRVWS